MHPEGSTAGDTEECWESFPERDAQPIPEVFQGAPEPGEFVPLEMGDDDHRIRVGDLGADRHLAEDLPLDRHPDGAFPAESVRDDEGRPRHGPGEAVRDRGVQVVDRVAAGADVKRVGVGQERPPPGGGDLLDDLSDEDRADEGGVPLLPEVELDGGQGAPSDPLPDSGRSQERPRLVDQAVPRARGKVREPDGRLHRIGLALTLWRKYPIIH